jgi:hypothetical protein
MVKSKPPSTLSPQKKYKYIDLEYFIFQTRVSWEGFTLSPFHQSHGGGRRESRPRL